MTLARKKPAVTGGSLSTHTGFSLISNEKLLGLYTAMLKCRMLEERAREIAGRKARAAATGSSAVHDAAIAGTTIDLLPEDTLVPSRGGLVQCFAKGMPLRMVFASLTGSRDGARPSYASMNIVPPSLSAATRLKRAMQAAMKARAKKKIVVVFCADAESGASSFEDAMKRAGEKKLPMLFVCPSGRHAGDIAAKAHECGLPHVAVDGDDAVAVYRVATEAIAHARRGSGPTLIECKPWPLSERSRGRRRAGKPIRAMEEYLTRKGLFSKSIKAKARASFARELDAAARR